jgi:hypothetical protein
MPADDRLAICQPEFPSQFSARLLDLYPGVTSDRVPEPGLHFPEIRPAFPSFRIPGEGGDEGRDFLDDESPLTRASLDQTAGGEPLERVPDRIARSVVLFPEFDLSGQLTPRRYFAQLDLAPEILGDLPVHGVSHGTSQRYQPVLQLGRLG